MNVTSNLNAANMSAGRTLFIVALMFRHRIRYAIERFLYTGKVDEGLAKTIESNLSTLRQSKVVALPRVSSEAAMVSLLRQQQHAATSHSADRQFAVPPSPSLSTTSLSGLAASDGAGVAYGETFTAAELQRLAIALPEEATSSSSSSSLPSSATAARESTTPSSSAHARPMWPYALPRNKLGKRICGCPEASTCVHKNALGKPLASYEAAYAEWRTATDRKCLLALAVWLLARKFVPKDHTLLRRATAVAVQLSCGLMPQLVVLYKATAAVDARASFWPRIAFRTAACYLITVFASHATCSLPAAMVQACGQFKYPSIPPLLQDGPSAPPPSPPSSSAVAIERASPQPTAIEILAQAWRDTPRATLRMIRFYGILFLIIRPLMRMKNPFRKSAQVCTFYSLLEMNRA